MKKIIKRLLIPLLVLSMIVGTTNFIDPAIAVASDNISVYETIAKNAPYTINDDDWASVKIVSNRPLYDFNNKLVAYSFDLKNDNNDKGYVIISTSENDEPIYEFHEGAYSPYDNVPNNQTCIYYGLTGYYSYDSSENKYNDLFNNSELKDETVKHLIKDSKNKKYIAKDPDGARKERAFLQKAKISLSSLITTSPTIISKASYETIEKKILWDVPDYVQPENNHCAPTAAAIILKYIFPDALDGVSSTNLIYELATAMGTSPITGTWFVCINPGMEDVMNNHGENVTTLTNYEPTYTDAKITINNNIPVVFTMLDSSVYYNHAVALNGYKKAYNASTGHYRYYLYIRDTISDGLGTLSWGSSQTGDPDFLSCIPD